MRNVNTENTTGRVRKTALSLLLVSGCIYGGNTLAQSVTEASTSAQANADLQAGATINRAQVVNALKNSASGTVKSSTDLAAQSGASAAGGARQAGESTKNTVSESASAVASQTTSGVLLNSVGLSDDGESSQVNVAAAANAATLTTAKIDSMQDAMADNATASGEAIVDVGADIRANTQAFVESNAQTTQETVDAVSGGVVVESNLDVAAEFSGEISQQSANEAADVAQQSGSLAADINSVTEITGGLAGDL